MLTEKRARRGLVQGADWWKCAKVSGRTMRRCRSFGDVVCFTLDFRHAFLRWRRMSENVPGEEPRFTVAMPRLTSWTLGLLDS